MTYAPACRRYTFGYGVLKLNAAICGPHFLMEPIPVSRVELRRFVHTMHGGPPMWTTLFSIVFAISFSLLLTAITIDTEAWKSLDSAD